MRQSDYYKKKNFANPNIFQSSSNNSSNERNMPVPTKPIVSRPSPPPPVTNNVPANTKDDKKEQEELGTGHLLKHPLQHSWTLWYKENDGSKSWEDNQHQITTFDTVEDFWSLYNHIKPPSDIKMGTDYSLFKEGIRPMWEDQANKLGGCWAITSNKPSGKLEIDNMWLDVLLCLIGEAFEHSDEINGAVITSRKLNKISIWTVNANNSDAILAIGHKLKESLRFGNYNLTYHLHKDVMAKQGSVAKSIYSL